MFEINLGTSDRFIRFIVSITIISLAIIYFSGITQYILIIIASGLMFNSITGFCGIYRFLEFQLVKSH